jgi:hypothetical protein
MKYKYIIILLFIVQTGVGQILVPKKDYVPEIRQSRYSLAICLMSGANTVGLSYGIMRQNPDSTHEIIFLTKSSFIRQATAHERSRANPNKINYFEEYNINPKVLDNIWKLRYAQHPFTKEQGWGTKLGVPSKAQYGMLNQFGVYHLRDYIFGDKLWLFLQKMNDPAWTAQYNNLSGQ